MTVEHDPHDALNFLNNLVNDTDAAESFLSEDEKELFVSYNAAVTAIEELYPEGLPEDQSEAILESVAKRFPGIDDILDKIKSKADEIRRMRIKSGRLQ